MTHHALSDHPEQQYLDLLRELLEAPPRATRNDTDTRSVFGRQMRFDLAKGFPLLTTKRVFWRGVVAELLWMLSGSTNVKPLQDQGVTIWDEWAGPDGELGPVYGAQWRSWHHVPGTVNGQLVIEEVDQIATVLRSLREDPNGRRHIVSAWNAGDIGGEATRIALCDDASERVTLPCQMALPPCHAMFQFYVENDGRLSCQLYQRSADIFLGVPFNIASYALLTEMFADVLDREAGHFIWSGGDVHLYGNHVDQAREQISRTPLPFPSLLVATKRGDMDSWIPEDFDLVGYNPWPVLRAEVSR